MRDLADGLPPGIRLRLSNFSLEGKEDFEEAAHVFFFRFHEENKKKGKLALSRRRGIKFQFFRAFSDYLFSFVSFSFSCFPVSS